MDTSSLIWVPRDPSFSLGAAPREFLQVRAPQLSWLTWDTQCLYSKPVPALVARPQRLLFHREAVLLPATPSQLRALEALGSNLQSWHRPLSTLYHQN